MNMQHITVISNALDSSDFRNSTSKAGFFGRRNFVELTHRVSDPGTWIVRHSTKFMWFKKRISSVWFNDEHQAMAFADEIKRKHDGHQGSRDVQESLRYAE